MLYAIFGIACVYEAIVMLYLGSKYITKAAELLHDTYME